MAAINREVTEEQLKEAYEAVVAVQCKKGHTITDAKETARLLSYAVFRNLVTFDSLTKSIVDNARKVFVQ